jgi:diguanylate cyclase (GGDEF)-like protein
MGGTTAICTRRNELTDEMMKWQFSPVKWFDGRDVVLCKLMARGEEDDINNLAKCTCDNDKDSLTGLQNGMRFYTAAEHEFQENREKNYAVVVFDIDRFKGINDLYGMVNGDDALKHIAGSLRNVFGYGNNYARLRSDVFSFYMEYEKKGDIIKMIEKLRKEINANNFEFDINTSYGIYPVTDVFVPVNLMCDRAMMASRTTKGNILKFCAFYDEQYREDMIKANEIEHDMNSALENQDFKMYLQPKYRLDDYELCGAEVLCRWVHPKKGIIAPNDFIPLF